jgi:long-subunit fatty acid transport protein
MKKYILIILLILPVTIFSQNVEDALRYATPNGLITPRVAGLNIAYHGVADDMGALFYNPAGMVLVGKNELSLGFNFNVNNTQSDYLNSEMDFSTNNEGITNVGLIAPVQTGNKKAAIGIAYFRESDFFNTYDFSGFNDNSTLISHETYNRGGGWAEQLELAANNFTPYNDSLFQNGSIDSRGGIHTVTGGAGFEVNEYVSLGFALTGKWGGFQYDKIYTETDNQNVYSTADGVPWEDLTQLEYLETVDQNVSGISGMIGLQARIEDFMRFGAAVRLPTWYEVEETFRQRANVKFDTDPDTYRYDSGDLQNAYKITTPFIYSAGLSLHALGLTFSAGVEYTDVSQLQFSDALPEIEALNSVITRTVVGQTTWGFGAEYSLPGLPFAARASYGRTTSPYQQDIPNANKSWFSVGGSVYLGEKVRVDGVMRWTDVSEQRVNYGSLADVSNYSTYVITQNPLNISLGITYRY